MTGHDLTAFDLGQRNGAAARLAFDDCPRHADAVERALFVAGFEQARIAKGIGRFPVAVHHGRRRFWLVAPGVFNASASDAGEPPSGTAGYRDLRALFRLKGESVAFPWARD